MTQTVENAYKALCEAMAKQKGDPATSKALIEDNEGAVIEFLEDFTDYISKGKAAMDFLKSLDEEEDSDSASSVDSLEEPDSIETDTAEPAHQLTPDIETAKPKRKRARNANPLASKQTVYKAGTWSGSNSGW